MIGAIGGGFIDPANAGGGMRRPLGSRLQGITHGTDWYATFAALGGISSADPRAEAAGLPPPGEEREGGRERASGREGERGR